MDFETWWLAISRPVEIEKSYIPQNKALEQENWLNIWYLEQLCFNSHHMNFSEKGPRFTLRGVAAFYEGHAPKLLAQNSWISGLSNEVKHISEFQAVFEKITKKLDKIYLKILGMRKLNFPSVIGQYV